MTQADVREMIYRQADAMMLISPPPIHGGFIIPFVDIAGMRLPMIKPGSVILR